MIYKQIKNVQIRSKWLLDLLSLDIRKCVISSQIKHDIYIGDY